MKADIASWNSRLKAKVRKQITNNFLKKGGVETNRRCHVNPRKMAAYGNLENHLAMDSLRMKMWSEINSEMFHFLKTTPLQHCHYYCDCQVVHLRAKLKW